MKTDVRDLVLAKETLVEHGVTLVFARGGEVIFESGSRGVSGFLDAVEIVGEGLRDASVADKVMGKAVALLCVYSGVRCVYAVTLGLMAERVFDENDVYYECDGLVENILNAERSGVCVFERTVMDVSDGEAAFVRLRRLRGELAKGLRR